MKIKALCLAMGVVGMMSLASSVHADPILFNVKIAQTDDNGNIVGSWNEKTWDLTNSALWSQTTTDGHTLNDLKSTLSWKDGSAPVAVNAGINVSNLTFDVDPALGFDFTTYNNTSFNQTYVVSYNTPLVPNLSGLINSHADLTVTLSDLGGLAGAFVKPANGNGDIMKSWDLTVDGNEIQKNVDIGSQVTTTGSPIFFSENNTLVCGTGGAACETMVSTLTFTLSKGDQVRLQGNLEQVAAVPVPGAVWLFGSAMAGFVGLRRRKH
jgi:hypothetical protein